MWIFVHYDLPTETKKDRQQAALFRKLLLKDGFTMLQYSIYTRHCASRENADVHIKRVKSILPPKGEVVLFTLTVFAVFFIAPEIVNNPEDLQTAQAILLISGLSLSLEFPSKAFPGVISAYLRFDTIALVRTLGSILSAIAIFLFISNGSGVVTLAIISFVTNIFPPLQNRFN